MSELSRRGRSRSGNPTVFCFCETCDRVLYVDPDSRYCPVCSSVVVEVTPQDEISFPDVSDAPKA